MIDYIDANTFADFSEFQLLPKHTGDSIRWNPDITKKNRIVLEDAYSENIKVSRAYKDLIEPKKEVIEVKPKEIEIVKKRNKEHMAIQSQNKSLYFNIPVSQ